MRLEETRRLDSHAQSESFASSGASQEPAALDFSEVFRAHGEALYGRALWLTKTKCDAADLLQDTIERAIRGKRRHIDPAFVMRWLLTIMHNTFLDNCRAQAIRRSVPNGHALLEQIASECSGPEPLWRIVDDNLVDSCVARLPQSMQDTFRMHVAGMPYAELAVRLQIPVGTLGTRLLRIRRRLRRFLCEAAGIDEPPSPPRSRRQGRPSGSRRPARRRNPR